MSPWSDWLEGGPPFDSGLVRGVTRRFIRLIDLEPVIGSGVVAAIAGIGDAAIEDVADEPLHLQMTVARACPSQRLPGSAAT
jgi:hypothetical protein